MHPEIWIASSNRIQFYAIKLLLGLEKATQVDKWGDEESLIKTFGLIHSKTIERVTLELGSLFDEEGRTNDPQQILTAKMGSPRKTCTILRPDQSSFFNLSSGYSATAYSRRALRSIESADKNRFKFFVFCIGRSATIWSVDKFWLEEVEPFDYIALAPAYAIIKGISEHPVPIFPT